MLLDRPEALFVSLDTYERKADEKYIEIFNNHQFTNQEIQNICSLSKIQIIHLCQSYVIIPFHDARGRGKVRTFDFENLVEFMIARELNLFGTGVNVMKAVMDFLRNTKFIFSITNSTESASNSQFEICTIWELYKKHISIDFLSLAVWYHHNDAKCLKYGLFDLQQFGWFFERSDTSASLPHTLLHIKLSGLIKEIKLKVKI